MSSPYVIIATIVVIAVTLVSGVDGQTTEKVLCLTPRPGRTAAALHARYAAAYYSSLYPTPGGWRLKLVGRLEGDAMTPRAMLSAWLANSSDCAALIGPGSSSLATAIAPVAALPWVDFSATASELSDKTVYSTFSRVAPTDDLTAGLVAETLLKQFGWRNANVFCVDESYGRSVSSGFTGRFLALGGRVAQSTCVSSSADADKVEEVLRLFEGSRVRVVFVGGTATTKAVQQLFAVALAKKYNERMIFVLSESACSSGTAWAALAGSLCMTYSVNATRIAPFLDAYRARDPTADVADLRAAGFADAAMDLNGTNTFAAFAADAVQLVMAALSGAPPTANTTALITRLRQTKVEGFSGLVALDARGDRPLADLVLLNAAAAGRAIVLSAQSSAWLLGREVPANETVEDSLAEPFRTPLDTGSLVGLIVGICVVVCFSALTYRLCSLLSPATVLSIVDGVASGGLLLVCRVTDAAVVSYVFVALSGRFHTTDFDRLYLTVFVIGTVLRTAQIISLALVAASYIGEGGEAAYSGKTQRLKSVTSAAAMLGADIPSMSLHVMLLFGSADALPQSQPQLVYVLISAVATGSALLGLAALPVGDAVLSGLNAACCSGRNVSDDNSTEPASESPEGGPSSLDGADDVVPFNDDTAADIRPHAAAAATTRRPSATTISETKRSVLARTMDDIARDLLRDGICSTPADVVALMRRAANDIDDEQLSVSTMNRPP